LCCGQSICGDIVTIKWFFCGQRNFVLDTLDLAAIGGAPVWIARAQVRLWRKRKGNAICTPRVFSADANNQGAKVETMPGTRKLLVYTVAGAAACLSAAPAAACFRHTFEACPAAAKSAYTVALDRKTGRTWLTQPQDSADDDEELAELAAKAAKNLARRPVSRGPEAHAAGWRTRVDLAKADPSPSN
jgi:hypothetical protein